MRAKELLRQQRFLLFAKLTIPLVLFFSIFPDANAERKSHLDSQANSNDPCSKYVAEDWQSPFREDPTPIERSIADRLYARSVVITAHDHCYATHDFADMKAGGITARTIKLTTDNTHWTGGVINITKGELPFFAHASGVASMVLENNPEILIIRSVADIRRAKQTGKPGVIVSFEGGAVADRPNGCDHPPIAGLDCTGSVRSLLQLGLREFQPYWGTDNWLKSRPREPVREEDIKWEEQGLNDYGKFVLKTMVDSGVVLDLSHMGQTPFNDALKVIGDRPFILSHAGVAAVSLCEPTKPECARFRDWNEGKIVLPLVGGRGGMPFLDERTIQTVKDHQGVVALHFLEAVVSWYQLHGTKDREEVTVSNLVDEIEYFKTKYGIDYVALGPDYFPGPFDDGTWVRGLRDMTELRNVAREMVHRRMNGKRVFSEVDIQKVLGGNLLRVYEATWNDHQKPIKREPPTD